MKKKIMKKAICFALSFVMAVCNLCMLPTQAATSPPTVYDTGAAEETEILYEFEKIPEAMVNDEISQSIVLRTDTDADEKNVIKYFMNDGSYSMRIFPVDVKYTDREGIVRDKSNRLYEINDKSIVTGQDSISGAASSGESVQLFKYGNLDNDIVSRFPLDAYTGVLSSYNGSYVLIYPSQTYISCRKAVLKEDSVLYENAFGNGTVLSCRATFTGAKSDIILKHNTGRSSFSFFVETNGAELAVRDGVCYIYNGDEAVAEFGEVYVEDSSGKYVFGTVSVNTVEEYNKYELILNVPESFLNAGDTVYPVTVDPSLIFVTTNAYGSNNIVNCDITSLGCTTGGTLSQSSVITLGMTGTSTISNVLIKFPNLYPVINSLGSSITGAQLTLYRQAAYSGSSSTYLYAKPVTQSWSLGSKTASAYSSLYNAYTSTNAAQANIAANASASGSNTLTITNIVKQWSAGTYVSGGDVYGLNLSIGNNSYQAKYHGATTQTAAKMPRLTVTYAESSVPKLQSGIYLLSPYTSRTAISSYYLNRSGSTSTQIKAGSISQQNYPKSSSGYISYMHDLNQLFKIEYTNPGYTIKCLATNEYLSYSNNYLCFTGSDDTSSYSTRWFIVNVGGKYYICDYFYNYLYAVSPETASSAVTVKSYTETDGRFWSLKLYCLDVPHRWQETNNTCGAASAKLILNYIGIDISNLSDITVREKGIALSPNDTGSYGREQVQAALNYYAKILDGKDIYKFFNLSNYNITTFTNACLRNISVGYPVIIAIKSDSIVSPFTYETTGHFLVIAGMYKDASDNYRAVLVDPHYDTNPSKPSTNKANAIIDISMASLFPLVSRHSDTLIRNIS